MLLRDVQNPANWRKTSKKYYDLWVCIPSIGTKVVNFLEGSEYRTSNRKPFILSGTAGECQTIDETRLYETYRLFGGAKLNKTEILSRMKNGILDWTHIETIPNNKVNWAFYLDPNKYGEDAIINLPVQTSQGELLLANRPDVEHGAGDFIVSADRNNKPYLNDIWVVNGIIFPRTYDMRRFKTVEYNEIGTRKQTPRPAIKVY